MFLVNKLNKMYSEYQTERLKRIQNRQYFKVLSDRYEKLLQIIEPHLSATRIKDVQQIYWGGETELAFEHLCTVLIDDEVKISQDIFEHMKEIVEQIQNFSKELFDSSRWRNILEWLELLIEE